MSDVKTRQVSSVKSARDLVSLLNSKPTEMVILANSAVTRLETHSVSEDRRGVKEVQLSDAYDAFAGNTTYGVTDRRQPEIEKLLYDGAIFITPVGAAGKFSIGHEFNKVSVQPQSDWKVRGKNGASYATIFSKQGNIRVYVNGHKKE